MSARAPSYATLVRTLKRLCEHVEADARGDIDYPSHPNHKARAVLEQVEKAKKAKA